MITREMKDDVNRYVQQDDDWTSDKGYAFYYRCLFEHKLGLLDADGYAHLNTLIGYDIGMNNALQIIEYLWEHDIETLELSINEESKQDVKDAVDALHLNVNLSKWRKDKFELYEYYETEE